MTPDLVTKLKERLRGELSKTETDYSEIIRLSQEIAKHDTAHVRFTVDAGIVDRIGRELVGRKETAVSELVKNSYDADATIVNLDFVNSNTRESRIVIEDDGVGMTRADIIRGFMRLSSSEKVIQPRSRKYRRARAGRKGIGRFATQRLGDKLTLQTQTEGADHSLIVEFIWSKYSAEDIGVIANRIQEAPPLGRSGTVLTISELRDVWTDRSAEEIRDSLNELIQPERLGDDALARSSKTSDPGFLLSVGIVTKDNRRVLEPTNVPLQEYAVATIEGFVSDDGGGLWSVRSGDKAIDHDGKALAANGQPFKHLRNVYFRVLYFIFAKPYMTGRVRETVRAQVRQNGGVRIYRNGFRVPPYGEEGNDWLGLDVSTRARTILPPHANHNFVGFVEITDEKGTWFEETSSREGLIHTDAYDELVEFLYTAITHGVLEVASARGKKQKTSQRDWEREGAQDLSRVTNTLLRIAGSIKKISPSTLPEAGVIGNHLESAIEQLRVHAGQREALIREISMLRVLAGLGLAIGEFTHEIRHFIPVIQGDFKTLLRAEKITKQSRDLIVRIERNFANLKAFTGYIDSAISANAQLALEPQEIRGVISRFRSFVEPMAKRAGIDITDGSTTAEDLLTRPMHPSEWASLLLNLYTNSHKAIVRAGKQGKIEVRASLHGEMIRILFSDNGDGIQESIAGKIFDPFFTTSRPTHGTDEHDVLVGSGLGLSLVRDILESYGGRISLARAAKPFSTSFLIEIPRYAKEDSDAKA